MNYLKKRFKITKNKLKIKRQNNSLLLENNSNKRSYLQFAKPFINDGINIKIDFKYEILKGNGCELKLLNKKFRVVDRVKDSSSVHLKKINRCLFFCISVEAYSSVLLNEFVVENEKKEFDIVEKANGDILLISPNYPTLSNKYNYAFVHTRVLEYKKLGWNIDVCAVSDEYIERTNTYNFEGVNVIDTGYNEIRVLLQRKKYKKIFIHFFKEQYAQILDASNISDTDIFIFNHGSDILYRDTNILCRKYFEELKKYSEKELEYFAKKDKIIKRYNEMPNVKFILPSKWVVEHAEEINNIKFNNYAVLPTYIDEYTFDYKEKDENQRKKIVIIRKYDNLSTYSIDTDVKVILELSKKSFFNDLEFNIYGDGELHDKLLEPLKSFENVHIYKKFLTHKEIANVHKENGIGLFATRYETQGVSAAEAAMSGLVVLSNNVAAVPEMFNKDINLLAENEDYKKMAEYIEELYKNPKKFKKLSREFHEVIKNKYGYKNTIEKEVKVLSETLPRKKYLFKKIEDKKILTIAVAAYNVEKYLYNSIESLIKSKYAEKIEILIINDGSKDSTSKIGQYFEKLTTIEGKSIVKLIDKENGGHGSTINKGIELATGKYFKMMDGDDYFDTESLDKLIEYLEKSNEDIILTNYVEDLSIPGILNPIRHYDFMSKGKKYDIETLCKEGKFNEWGPLLSTSTFKTEILKNANYKISEHCFYVDMELNSIAFVMAKTIKYYPLDIYIYYLGRSGQSISAASFKRNYKHHERVIFRILDDIYYKEKISDVKKKYLKDKILVPLIKGQYYITTEHFKSGKEFREFDKRLKKYPEFYNDKDVLERRTKKYRKTKGYFSRTIKFLVKAKHLIKR